MGLSFLFKYPWHNKLSIDNAIGSYNKTKAKTEI